MKLLRAILYWDECRIDAVVDDGQGRLRHVETKCRVKERRMMPPKKWAEGVIGEARFQMSEELNPSIPR
jgi:hypothetical protein